MAFLASSKAQEIYAAANFEYPIAPGYSSRSIGAKLGQFLSGYR
jgi:hypothetical protein